MPAQSRSSPIAIVLPWLVLMNVASCDILDVTVDRPGLGDIVAGISLEGNVGIVVDADFPVPGSSSAPVISGNSEIVRGGSVILQVEVSNTATQLLIGLRGEQRGYFALELDNIARNVGSVTSASSRAQSQIQKPRFIERNSDEFAKPSTAIILTMIITFTTDDDYGGFSLRIAAMEGSSVSSIAHHAFAINETAQASDILQVSLNWSHPVDIDLHVETPNGEDVYYRNPEGRSGGLLDLDSNAGCEIDNVNNENITWLSNDPEPGPYIVRVDLWSACDLPGPFPFVVTINVSGKVTTYSGVFQSSEETYGDAYSGRIVGPRIGEIKFWINAFIPGTVSSGNPFGRTHTVPGDGPYAGQTMILTPFLAWCALTDQRSYSSDIDASSRLHSEVTIDLSDPNNVIINPFHDTDPTIEVVCLSGNESCVTEASTSNMKWQNLRRDGSNIRLDLVAKAHNECAGTTGLSPNIHYTGTLSVDVVSNVVEFSGKVDDYPAYEAYLVIDEDPVATMFRKFNDSKSVLDLLGIATNEVGGVVTYQPSYTFMVPGINQTTTMY